MPSCLQDYPLPAPNFGKTFGPSVTTGQSWIFGDAASLSEIGRREMEVMPENGTVMRLEISKALGEPVRTEAKEKALDACTAVASSSIT